MNNVPIVVSFSGGRTSAFMAKMIKEHAGIKGKKVFVFSNTGKEEPETLEFVNECDKRWNLNLVWIEADVIPEKGEGTEFKIVDYLTANRKGKPFENVIAKYGIPNVKNPFCSRELKQVPLYKFAKSLNFDYWNTAIGFRADEGGRADMPPLSKKYQYIYPLAEMNIDSIFIRKWWTKQDFDLQLKDYEGNCDMCYKKSRRKILTIVDKYPEKIEWWKEMEIKFGEGKYTFFRGGDSADDIIEQSKQPFVRAIDELELSKQTPQLFDDMGIEFNCFCPSV